jgi:hypothetical protein
MKKFIRKIIKVDKLLDKQFPLYVILVLILLLRIPNFFEPYWYGDEGIYLTIGQSMNKGAALYTEIIDHKTPLIYYLAKVHTQLNFRLLNLAFALVFTTSFYYLSRKLLKSVRLAFLATLIFALLTTLQWFEGHIPNGELFVLGFVLPGFLIATNTSYFKTFLDSKSEPITTRVSMKDFLLLSTAGFLFGLGILTKVPALLDLAALFSIGWLGFTNRLQLNKLKSKSKEIWQILFKKFSELSIIFLGALIPILISILYFVSIGSGADYLEFGLLYNFRYAASWNLPFDSQFLQASFTLQGKIIYLVAIVLIITSLKKYLKPSLQFASIWLVVALFATLLSNRPYPHYFIQLVPPLALLLTEAVHNLYIIAKNLYKNKSIKTSLLPTRIVSTIVPIGLISLFVIILLLLRVRPYAVQSYYTNWFQLVTGQVDKVQYRQRFNSLMRDNYKAAEIINSTGTESIFIWGTNPMLYALSDTKPAGRFTVAFHIKDFDAFDETIRDVVKTEPKFIVMMRNEKHYFPELQNFLNYNYIPDNNNFDHFVLWKKTESLQ